MPSPAPVPLFDQLGPSPLPCTATATGFAAIPRGPSYTGAHNGAGAGLVVPGVTRYHVLRCTACQAPSQAVEHGGSMDPAVRAGIRHVHTEHPELIPFEVLIHEDATDADRSRPDGF
jgi:hypothetical protein